MTSQHVYSQGTESPRTMGISTIFSSKVGTRVLRSLPNFGSPSKENVRCMCFKIESFTVT